MPARWPTLIAAVLLFAVACADVSSTATPPSTEPPNTPSPTQPTVLEVTCNADGGRLSTDVVVAQAEGVAVRFVTDTDVDALWAFSWRAEAAGAGDRVPDHVVYLPIPPGRGAQLSCTPVIRGHESEASDDRWTAAVEVIDPNGHWVDDRLSCRSAMGFSALGTVAPTPVPISEAPTEVAKVLSGYGVDPGEVRRAGYVEAQAPPFVVVRDGRILARVRTMPAGDGTVIVDPSAHLCESLT